MKTSMFMWSLGLMLLVFDSISAQEVLQVQNNPVPDGTISIDRGDADRLDWDGIGWFEEDEEDEAEPVDIHRIQVAHDQTYVYFHLETNAWDTEESWRVGLFLDVDQDFETGYNPTRAVGADYLSEGELLWEFTGAGPDEWSWEQVDSVRRDQTDSMLDVEWAIPRAEIDDPDAFDFYVLANNECCDFGLPLDFYPDFANAGFDGEFFRYELGPVQLKGDFDGSGELDAADIDALTAAIGNGGDISFDLNGDGVVDQQDRVHWVEELKNTYFGDSNLDGEFSSSDFVSVFAAGEYEDDVSGNSTWVEGDWNGDGDFQSSDFVAAFQGQGYENGPRTLAIVPEPKAIVLLIWLVACYGRVRRLL